jgi:hypothetical protein
MCASELSEIDSFPQSLAPIRMIRGETKNDVYAFSPLLPIGMPGLENHSITTMAHHDMSQMSPDNSRRMHCICWRIDQTLQAL